MSRLATMLADDGLFLTLQRLPVLAFRKLRNRAIASRLACPGFYCGHAPRLLGLRFMKIGARFHAGEHVWLHAIPLYEGRTFQPQLLISADVTLSDNVHIACIDRIEIGPGCLFGSHVIVIDHGHGSYRGAPQSSPDQAPALRPLVSNAPITIGRNVWLGDGVAVLPGSTIGDGAIIGANSVVTGPIPANTIAVGAPARPIRQWDAPTEQWLPINS